MMKRQNDLMLPRVITDRGIKILGHIQENSSFQIYKVKEGEKICCLKKILISSLEKEEKITIQELKQKEISALENYNEQFWIDEYLYILSSERLPSLKSLQKEANFSYQEAGNILLNLIQCFKELHNQNVKHLIISIENIGVQGDKIQIQDLIEKNLIKRNKIMEFDEEILAESRFSLLEDASYSNVEEDMYNLGGLILLLEGIVNQQNIKSPHQQIWKDMAQKMQEKDSNLRLKWNEVMNEPGIKKIKDEAPKQRKLLQTSIQLDGSFNSTQPSTPNQMERVTNKLNNYFNLKISKYKFLFNAITYIYSSEERQTINRNAEDLIYVYFSSIGLFLVDNFHQELLEFNFKNIEQAHKDEYKNSTKYQSYLDEVLSDLSQFKKIFMDANDQIRTFENNLNTQSPIDSHLYNLCLASKVMVTFESNDKFSFHLDKGVILSSIKFAFAYLSKREKKIINEYQKIKQDPTLDPENIKNAENKYSIYFQLLSSIQFAQKHLDVLLSNTPSFEEEYEYLFEESIKSSKDNKQKEFIQSFLSEPKQNLFLKANEFFTTSEFFTENVYQEIKKVQSQVF